ncbi:hypothetical protein [Acidimicrobium ferrooxidans]|uniref:hypothetical protein n=1 Tax=Acidimicrobium ferrooxidans TaxID=53635 RepID=UPI00019DE24F|nr:hypothetical protein [Acidimicrobium ferrooxidans]
MATDERPPSDLAGEVHGPSSSDGSTASTAAPSDARAEEEAARLRAELLDADVGDLIANHAYGLFELTRIYLAAEPPRLADATLVIDALAGLLAGVADRLGERGQLLEAALRQVQLAFVRLRDLTHDETAS